MVLLIAYVPIWCLYFVWLPLTCMGKIQAIPDEEEDRTGGTADASRDQDDVVVVNVLQSPVVNVGL